MHFGAQMVSFGPGVMQTIPIEDEIKTEQKAMPYEHVSTIIENGQSYALFDCICKKEKGIMGNPCEKPLDICMGISPEPRAFDKAPRGKPITRDEAYAVLKRAEEAGLVHMTSNVENGHWFICNCCGCCCGVLGAIKNFGLTQIANSHYYAEIDPEACTLCGTCLEERCQIDAIEEGEDAYRIITEKCIGCGLCVTTCPGDAIKLVRKPDADIVRPPKDENAWNQERARQRGVDYSMYQ
jgi:ferredoxin